MFTPVKLFSISIIIMVRERVVAVTSLILEDNGTRRHRMRNQMWEYPLLWSNYGDCDKVVSLSIMSYRLDELSEQLRVAMTYE